MWRGACIVYVYCMHIVMCVAVSVHLLYLCVYVCLCFCMVCEYKCLVCVSVCIMCDVCVCVYGVWFVRVICVLYVKQCV